MLHSTSNDILSERTESSNKKCTLKTTTKQEQWLQLTWHCEVLSVDDFILSIVEFVIILLRVAM